MTRVTRADHAMPAPGSVLVVRDEEWLVLRSEASADGGWFVDVQGLTELVRDTAATFSTALDVVEVLDPAAATVVADGTPGYRRSRLWLEAMQRKTAVPITDPTLTVAAQGLADALPYQLDAVRKALDPQNLRPRILLADAVGLGKTIEIGMILAELVRRGRGERILVVTPRHVLEQMQFELWTRFALPFVRGAPAVRRTGVVALRLTDGAASAVADGDASIRMSIWGRDAVVRDVRPLPTQVPSTDSEGVRWFDVDPPGSDTAAQGVEQRAQHVLAALESRCSGLTEEMVREVLQPDPHPKVETYGDEQAGVRAVSVVAAIAREGVGDEDDTDGVDEELVFQAVEMLVGDGWLVTCWHPSTIFTGTGEEPTHSSLLREPLLSHVEYRWLHDGPDDRVKTSSDLGMYLARSLVNTFGATHHMMERWISVWEALFFNSLTITALKDRAERLRESAREVSDLLAMVGETRWRLNALEQARYATPDRLWFPDLSDRDEEVEEEEHQSAQAKSFEGSIQSAAQKSLLLTDSIRADMDLLMLHTSATQQEQTEKLQGYLSKMTGLVLVPTLVVGLFGANTRLPGGGTWMGFELMLVLMLISSVAVYFVIHKLTK